MFVIREIVDQSSNNINNMWLLSSAEFVSFKLYLNINQCVFRIFFQDWKSTA